MNSFHFKDVESLMIRFPHMFSEPMVSNDFFRGWFPGFVDLCFEIDALLGEYNRSFYWCQLKEKFGSYTMRSAFRPAHGHLMPGELHLLHIEVRQKIGHAGLRMDNKCCVCGHAAKLGQHGLWAVLCDYHSRNARRARGDRRPLRELNEVPRKPANSYRWETMV